MMRLHPKYGVNPTIPLCFWCQKDRNEVVLLGAAYRGEAQRSMLLDYEPCDECKAQMNKGITLIECTPHTEHKLPPIGPGAYPTGRWCVVTEDYARRAFQPEPVAKRVLEHRKAFVEPGVLERLGVMTPEPAETGTGTARAKV